MFFPPPVYSFRNIDLVYDFLLSIGMKPYVELGYTATCDAAHLTCILRTDSCPTRWRLVTPLSSTMKVPFVLSYARVGRKPVGGVQFGWRNCHSLAVHVQNSFFNSPNLQQMSLRQRTTPTGQTSLRPSFSTSSRAMASRRSPPGTLKSGMRSACSYIIVIA